MFQWKGGDRKEDVIGVVDVAGGDDVIVDPTVAPLETSHFLRPSS